MDDNQNDDNPGHIAVTQVPTVNENEELEKDSVAGDSGDSDGEYSSLGSAGPEDNPDGDTDAGGVMDIDNALRDMGLEGDGENGEPHELNLDQRLDSNESDDFTTAKTDEPEELEDTE